MSDIDDELLALAGGGESSDEEVPQTRTKRSSAAASDNDDEDDDAPMNISRSRSGSGQLRGGSADHHDGFPKPAKRTPTKKPARRARSHDESEEGEA